MLKGIYQGLMGNKGAIPTSVQNHPGALESSLPPLSDTDYEFLLMQLLEGVAHGWQSDRILKFFSKLDERGNQENWLAWLDRFEEKLLASATPNQDLGRQMILLSQQMRSLPKLREIGTKSATLGRKLMRGNKTSTSNSVWEYEEEAPVSQQKASTGLPSNLNLQTLTVDELAQRLDEDPNLRAYIAQELGVTTTDSQEIVQALLSRSGVTQNQETEPPADDVSAWFNRGIEKAQTGDWRESLRSWDKVLALQPDSKQAWFNRGGMLAMLHRHEEAAASFDKAIELQPDDPQCWYHRAVSLNWLQRWEDAIADCDRALELQSDYWQAWMGRGLAVENSVNLPPAPPSNFAQAYPSLQKRGIEGAIANYEEGLKQVNTQDASRLHWVLGTTYARKAERVQEENSYWQQAIDQYNQALPTLTAQDFPTEHLELLKNLTHAYRSIGETEKANELQQRGAEILQQQSQNPDSTLENFI